MNEGVSALLWRDTSCFRRRAVKAASTLAAVRRTLERHRPLGGREGEFLALCAELDLCPETVRSELQNEPYSYFWARIAFELLGTVLGRWQTPALARTHYAALGIDAPHDALHAHLDGFKRFAIAAGLLARRDCTFDEPFIASLPLAVPGTRLCLSGAGTVRLAGVRGGVLKLAAGAVDGDAVEVDECPTLALDGVAVRLQPHAYNLAGLDYFRPAAAAGLDFQRQRRAEVETAIALVRRYQPRSLGHFRDSIRILALKPPIRGSKRDNVSHSDLPGSILMSVIPRPHHLADVCIHETHHNRLFAIEDHEPLLADGNTPLEAAPRHYSPWQDEGRPLHGILHGLYVLIPVCRFWLAVHADRESDELVRALAADRAVRGVLQLRIGAHQVKRHGRLTDFGRLVFEELQAQVAALGDEIAAAGLSPSALAVYCDIDGSIEPQRLGPAGGNATIRDAVQHHLHASALSAEVGDIRRDVAL